MIKKNKWWFSHIVSSLADGWLESRDGSVVDSRFRGLGFESWLERRENFLLSGQLSALTLISVSVPPPCYRSSTWKILSFCQKCRWQITAQPTCILCMWFRIKWHCKGVHGVHRTCVETAAVSRDTSYVTTKQRCNHLIGYSKRAKLQLLV